MRSDRLVWLIAASAVLPTTAALAAGPNRRGGGDCLLIGSAAQPLTDQESADMLFMREEEKLARDVYLAMYDLWEHPTFANISESEQRHMDAVKTLIEHFGLIDPVVDDTPGAFTDPDLAALYVELVDAGAVSMIESFKVGALIEEKDIFDLQAVLAITANPDLQRVYTNLMRASRNHLRAFASLLTIAGESYEAQFLTQEEFDEIAASDWERGCTGQRCRTGSGSGKQTRNRHQRTDDDTGFRYGPNSK